MNDDLFYRRLGAFLMILFMVAGGFAWWAMAILFSNLLRL